MKWNMRTGELRESLEYFFEGTKYWHAHESKSIHAMVAVTDDE
jgi:hypothetical protein